jgi:hypothetical protein
MYSFFINSGSSLTFIFFVEENYASNDCQKKLTLNDDTISIVKVDGELRIVIEQKFIIALNKTLLDLLICHKNLKIATNKFGDNEILIEMEVDIPDLFLGQILAYSKM